MNPKFVVKTALLSSMIKIRSVLRLGICLLGLAIPSIKCPAQTDSDLLPLPQWAPNEEGLAPLLGGLLPQDPQILQAGPSSSSEYSNSGPRLGSGPPQVYPELPPGLQIGDMGLFLPESLLSQPSLASSPLRPPTPEIALERLPPEVFEAAVNASADQRLIDPLGLISEMPKASLERFLEFHARDARIKTIVLLMDRQHKLPDSVDWERLSAEKASSGDFCLVVYPFGEPWRARVFLSRNVHESASTRYLADMAADCVSDSLQVSEPQDQLHRFVVRLSTRLFWLEKIMPARDSSHESQHGLKEVAESPSEPMADWMSLFAAIGSGWLLPSGIGVSALVALSLLIRRRRNVAGIDRSRVYILPEPNVEPRLGGAFSGGAGASASFK